MIAWIGAVRKLEATRNAGDPGPVPARRLSNAEYDNTIRDLTGVDLRPTKEFPVDPANEAGFDNSAESLAMSPALVKKYLEAARGVADHLVLTPDGLAFAPHSMLADTDRDKYCVRRIIDFYKRQKTDYADYFLAAWRFQHRAALGTARRHAGRLRRREGLSRKYLATIWATLTDGPRGGRPDRRAPGDVGRSAGARRGRPDVARAGLRADEGLRRRAARQLVPEVKNLTARGIGNGTQPFVLWKNRQIAANRMRYAGGAAKIRADDLGLEGAAAKALAVPEDPEDAKRFEATFDRFCRTFPDAFFVSERARVYLDRRRTRATPAGCSAPGSTA